MFIKVKVFPGAKKRDVTKTAEDRFEVRVKAKPQEGEANREAVQLLAAYFQAPEKSVKLVRGFKRRNKLFEVQSPAIPQKD